MIKEWFVIKSGIYIMVRYIYVGSSVMVLLLIKKCMKQTVIVIHTRLSESPSGTCFEMIVLDSLTVWKLHIFSDRLEELIFCGIYLVNFRNGNFPIGNLE